MNCLIHYISLQFSTKCVYSLFRVERNGKNNVPLPTNKSTSGHSNGNGRRGGLEHLVLPGSDPGTQPETVQPDADPDRSHLPAVLRPLRDFESSVGLACGQSTQSLVHDGLGTPALHGRAASAGSLSVHPVPQKASKHRCTR